MNETSNLNNRSKEYVSSGWVSLYDDRGVGFLYGADCGWGILLTSADEKEEIDFSDLDFGTVCSIITGMMSTFPDEVIDTIVSTAKQLRGNPTMELSRQDLAKLYPDMMGSI